MPPDPDPEYQKKPLPEGGGPYALANKTSPSWDALSSKSGSGSVGSKRNATPDAEGGGGGGGGGANPGGELPAGATTGDILYWSGTEWVPYSRPSSAGGVLTVTASGTPTWNQGVTENDMLRYDGTDWVSFDAPASTGNFILTVQDGVMTWQEVTDC